ncbi:preprotein translocase subunit SecY [Microbispora hainanensis]|uniref:Protein translocase subunit SecY n=1 Tax=Microbispora hainanensis TaxID=568844 RepID=A0ABZ1SKF2_9ACTN|nr:MULTISPECIES: preprotein translocase subunit SecY [Microbispora]NJP24364.1 preprotein translocase subunit SecY [Microbispora sp. CL1-1]TQS15150.1 preprotein translocase subunit SecY [Microbispora sp. SCL1-1]
MLTAITRAFRTPDLRKKLLFTLGIIVLFRLGSVLPTPGVNAQNVALCLEQAQAGDAANIYGMVQLFSGGALLKLSVFALGIMPYITASIILQLLTVVIPRLEALKKEGQAGTAKITQYTRYLTIGLAVLQSTAFVALARSGQLFQNCNQEILLSQDVFPLITMVITMTAGTAVIMWLGELVTDRGVGNGMSILIFTQVIAVFPSELVNIFRQSPFKFVIVMIVGIVMIGVVVFIEQAQRRIPVQYAKRMVGRRMYGGTSTYIPLKVNQAGIIPVIFASSLLYLPQLLVTLFGNSQKPNAVIEWLAQNMIRGDHPVYMATFFLLIVFFTYFYVSITFNPPEVADNMKKYGGFIPGIRPGRPTAEYLSYVLNRLTAAGAPYLGVISLIPIIALAVAGASQNFPFGGTSILIMVGVGLDTVKQIESQLQQRNYEGFLR